MRISDWSSDVCSSDLPGEALEDDAGEVVPVADKVGEDADEQRLLHQAGHDVVVGAPTPEERRERHVDDDQGGGDEGDFTAEETEAAVDVAGEDLEEMVDDAGRSEEHTSELQSLMSNSYAVFY